MPFRLPPDQMRRLDRAAKHCRKTRQSFVQEIVLSHIAEIEQGQQLKKLPPLTDTAPRQDRGVEQGGLGISATIKQRQEVSTVDPSPPTPAPVVVQVGGPVPTTGKTAPLSDLDRLALYVVKGDDFLRDARKRTSIDVLRASSTSDEELKVLVAQLEQSIAIKTKTAEENTPVNKLTRLAFDKLSALLRGD